MGKSVKGTRTEQCLLASFAGESQAFQRYSYFSSVADKEGYKQISAIFAESSYPAGIISNTVDNLKAAAAGENEEHTILYPNAAKIAREEGFEEIATAFEKISEVEAMHEARYRKLLSRIEAGNFFERDEEIVWQCRNCGFLYRGKKAPKACPACLHPQAYFEPAKDNY